MRSYQNRKGENVEVSKEHLETAVAIKLQLQKASPSRKCSWTIHKSLMVKEGFSDSDSNEAYRCMVKSYQKSINVLPELEKHVDMISSNKLESIKEMVGEISYSKREAQNEFRKLNKVKRDIIDYSLISDEIVKIFSSYKFDLLPSLIKRKEDSDKKMIVQISDTHIGAWVDNDINKFNYEIAKERVNRYMSKVVNECKINDITNVYVMQTGDENEHHSMHYTQSHESEMTLSEQIVKTTDLFINALVTLADSGLQVKFASICGNHSRLSGNKDMAQHGDTSTKIINYGVKSFIESSKIESLEFIESSPYEHSFEVNGVKIKAVHGDKDNLKDENILAKHSSLDNINYDMIIGGHIHTRRIVEVGNGKFIVTAGSLKGADNYSLDKLRKASAPSQNYYIINKDKEIEIKWVSFK